MATEHLVSGQNRGKSRVPQFLQAVTGRRDSLVCHPLALSNGENCGTPEICTRNVETGPDQGLNGNVQVPERQTNAGAGVKDCRVALTPAPRVPCQRGLAPTGGVRQPAPNYTSSCLRFHRVLRGVSWFPTAQNKLASCAFAPM